MDSARLGTHRRGTAWVWMLLGLILVAAAWLRFTGLERESRWTDEYFETISYYYPPQYTVLNSWRSAQPPLGALMGWAAVRIDDSLRGMRAPAAVFGVLSVGLCFLLVRKLSSAPAGLIAAALLAFSPLHFRMSQTARPYTICVAAFILMLWMLARALEQPDRRRLTWFALSACLLSLTRGLAPVAILFAFFVSLGVGYAWVRWRHQDTGEESVGSACRALGGTWLVTMLVGAATAVQLVILVVGARSYTVFSAVPPVQESSHFSALASSLLANVVVWGAAGPALFGSGATWVAALALLGFAALAVRWNTLPLSTRAVCAGALLAGPVYLTAYTVAVPERLITDRYGLFLLPVAAGFAAAGVLALLRALSRILTPRPCLRLGAALVLAGALLAGPARSTIAWTRLYFNADWRGCAACLVDKVTADDVVIVLQDRALGKYQPAFWGKCEWPEEGRPLAEAAWTLATSDSHWQRLLQQRGRCFLVIKYAEWFQPRDAYLARGLQSAPPGMQLAKFRGLDLLWRDDDLAPRAQAGLLTACDDLLKVPLEHADARAIPYLLRSRVELHAGDLGAARASLRCAATHVPAELNAWFERNAVSIQEGLRLADARQVARP